MQGWGPKLDETVYDRQHARLYKYQGLAIASSVIIL